MCCKIPCACQNTVYVGETLRLCQTRKKEHVDKVRLKNKDLHKGNTLSAEKGMGKEDGCLARHTRECQNGVDRLGKRRKKRERERIKAKKSSRRNLVTTTETLRNESF